MSTISPSQSPCIERSRNRKRRLTVKEKIAITHWQDGDDSSNFARVLMKLLGIFNQLSFSSHRSLPNPNLNRRTGGFGNLLCSVVNLYTKTRSYKNIIHTSF